MKNIDKYIIGKLSSSFFTVMIGLLSLAWLNQILKLLDEIVMRGADLSTFFMLSVTVLPNIISQIIPLAAFITSAFVLYNMSSDKEIIILLSTGMNPKRLFKPFKIAVPLLDPPPSPAFIGIFFWISIFTFGMSGKTCFIK